MAKLRAFLLGALGGLLPVLATLVTLDLGAIFSDGSSLTTGNCVGYVIRILALVSLGGIMAALNQEVQQPLALVQIGIAAPALVAGYINLDSVAIRQTALTMSVISTARADDNGFGKEFVVAGGFFGDVINGIITPLPKLEQRNNAKSPDALGSQLGSGRTVYPPIAPSTTDIPVGVGTYCSTPAGRFGPGPMNTVGAACQVALPEGTIAGFVTQ